MKHRILLGMDREPWEEFQKRHAEDLALKRIDYLVCPCGAGLSMREGTMEVLALIVVREHWQAGHFDVPVYGYVEVEYKITIPPPPGPSPTPRKRPPFPWG